MPTIDLTDDEYAAVTIRRAPSKTTGFLAPRGERRAGR
jgi:hypothetical protein